MLFRDPAFASMVASAQLLASSAPAALIVFTTLIINLRSPRSGPPKCRCKMNNCPPALSQLLWRGAGA